MNFLVILAYFSVFSPVIAIALFWKVPPKTEEMKVLRMLVIISFLFDLTGMALSFQRLNTYAVGNVFYLVQTLLLILLYKPKVRPLEKFFFPIAAVFTILFFINFFFIQGYKVLDTTTITVSAIIFVGLALFYFLDLLKNLPEVYVHRIPMVWINIGVLVYFAGNLLVFLFNDYFIMTTTWIVHNMLNITKNLFFTIAIWQSQRKTSSSSY